MKISNFSISPTLIAPGDEVSIAFTVKAQSGDTIGENGLMVWLNLPGHGEVIVYLDSAFTISKGQTKTVAAKTVFDPGSYTPARGSVVSAFGVQLGTFGSRVDVDFPLTLLDAWYRPAIPRFAAERCTDETPDDEGEGLLMSLALGTSAAAQIEGLSLLLTYRDEANPDDAQTLDLNQLKAAALAGELQTLLAGTYDKNADWLLSLSFGDGYETAAKQIEIPRAFANVHLSGASTGGVCFGSFSKATEGNPLFQCCYPAEFEAGIKGGFSYESGETDTGGRWIDGRKIYRRAIPFGPVAAGVKTYVAGLPEMGALVHLQGFTSREAGLFLPLTFYYSANNFNCVWAEANQLTVWSSHAVTNGCAVIEYTKSNEEVS